MKKPKKCTHKAIYTGRRIEPGGRSYQRFELLPTREERLFRGIYGLVIGRTYECYDSTMPARSRGTEDELVHDPSWDAEDALVDAANARRRADEKIAKLSKPALRAAVAALDPLVAPLGPRDRVALVEYLCDKIPFRIIRK